MQQTNSRKLLKVDKATKDSFIDYILDNGFYEAGEEIYFNDVVYPDRTQFYIITENDVRVGFCYTYSETPDYLNLLFVIPKYRRKGYGQFVLNELNIKTLYCFDDNLPAVGLYRKSGFVAKKTGVYTSQYRRT